MTLGELKNKWIDNFNNSNGTIIDFSLNQDHEANICFELGQYSGGDFGGTTCLKSEKINLKKGNKFQSAVIFIANDVSSDGLNRGVSINDSYVTMRYKDKQFGIPMSKIDIIDAKSVPQSELKSFSGDIVPNQSENSVVNQTSNINNSNVQQSFLEKHKTHLLIAGAVVLGVLVFKKFKK